MNLLANIIENSKSFSNIKRVDTKSNKMEGVGQTTILKFLGGGWKQWKIQSALDTLNAEDINMDAITTDGISLDLKWIILKS